MSDQSIFKGGCFGFLVFIAVIFILVKTGIMKFLLITLGVIVGIIALIVFIFVFNRRKKQSTINESNLSNKEFNDFIKDKNLRVTRLKRYAYSINDLTYGEYVKEMGKIAKWIVDNVKTNPADLRISKKFFSYYLESAITVVEQYAALEKLDVLSPNETETFERAKRTIKLLNEYFKKQKQKLLDDDYLNLKVEMEVLEKSLKSEGIYEPEVKAGQQEL